MLTEVWLYRVGRNLNRAYRTMEAFGVNRLILVECNESKLSGNLFASSRRVTVDSVNSLPTADGSLALETWGKTPLSAVDWRRVDRLVIGGETSGLPSSHSFEQVSRIPMCGRVSGLTVEAALAIALYSWSQSC